MRIKKGKDYVERLQELYPGVEAATIKKIITAGCHNMMFHLNDNKDVMISSSTKNVKFLVYKYREYFKEKEKNAKQVGKRI